VLVNGYENLINHIHTTRPGLVFLVCFVSNNRCKTALCFISTQFFAHSAEVYSHSLAIHSQSHTCFTKCRNRVLWFLSESLVIFGMCLHDRPWLMCEVSSFRQLWIYIVPPMDPAEEMVAEALSIDVLNIQHFCAI
jgi:hypothetical protein